MILIVAQDPDFTATLAEQVKNALAMDCHIVQKIDLAKPLIDKATLVVTLEKNGKYPCSVLRLDPEQAPFRMQKLLADIKELVQKQAADEGMALGSELTLMPRGRQLIGALGESIDLTDKETQLLLSLHEAGPKGLNKEQLLKQVWGHDAALDTHTLETHIYRLRGKIRELAGEEKITASEGGYKLI